MINAPQEVKDALSSRNFSYANLVTINLGDAYGTGSPVMLHLTDYDHSISFGGNTYTPDNNLTELSGISRKASTGTDSVDIVFSITDESLIGAINAQRYINQPTSIDRVIMKDGVVVGDFAIPIRTAWGISHTIGGDLEDRSITLTIDSTLGDLDGDNGWYVVNSSHEQRYPGDKIMKHGQTVMTEAQKKRYTSNFNGVINQEIKPPALPKIYGYKNVELIPICMLKHRKSHTSYRHYFTTLIYAVNIGDCDFVDMNNIKKSDESIDIKIVSNTARNVGGWSARLRTPADAEAGDLLSQEDNGDLSFWFEGMDSSEKARMSGMIGKGLTLIFVKNRNRDNWLHSAPELTVPVRGSKLFDPRTGLTQFSRNPALQYADYLKSIQYGAGKRGIPVSDSNIATLADHFDQIPGSIGNPGINDIHIDIQIDTSEPIVDNMNIWMEGVRLYTSDYYGQFNIRVETISPVNWIINEDDLHDFPEYESGEFTERLNQLTYSVKQLVPDLSITAGPNDLVEVDVEATFPPDGDPIHVAWLAEDGGIVSFDSEQLDYVTELQQAYYWAMVDARTSRQQRTLEIMTNELGWLSEVGDVIQFSSSVMDMTDELWRVDEVTESDEDSVELKLIAYDDNFYTPDPNSIPDPVPYAQPPTGVELSAASGLAITMKGGLYYLEWTPVSSSNVSWYAVEITKDAQPFFENSRIAQPPLLLENITVGNYEARITTIGINDEGGEAVLQFSVDLPETPIINVIVGSLTIEISPTVSQAYLGSTFEVLINTENNISTAQNRGKGGSFTLNVAANTTYYLWVRTVNVVGESNWATTQVTTLAGEDIADLIGEIPSPDLTGVQQDIEDLDRQVDQVLEDIIWNTVNIQTKTTETGYNQAKTSENNQAIADESSARATQAEQLQANIDTESGRIDSTISRVDQVEVDIDGNASAISAVQGQVNNPTTGLSAAYSLAQSANTTANGNASALNVLSNNVNNPSTGLSATNTLAQSAKADANGNSSAITLIQNNVNDPSTGLSATNTLAQEAKTTADGNTSAVTALQASIDDIIGSGAPTTAELQLAVTGNANDIDSLKAETFLYSDVNGNIAGIKTTSTGSLSELSFIGDKVNFLKQNGTKAIYFDIVTGEYVFNGTGTFTGAIKAGAGSEISGVYIENATIGTLSLIDESVIDDKIANQAVTEQTSVEFAEIQTTGNNLKKFPAISIGVYKTGGITFSLSFNGIRTSTSSGNDEYLNIIVKVFRTSDNLNTKTFTYKMGLPIRNLPDTSPAIGAFTEVHLEAMIGSLTHIEFSVQPNGMGSNDNVTVSGTGFIQYVKK